MSGRLGINGFGRMGRLGLRAAWQWPEFDIIHLNEIQGGTPAAAHLLEFDTVHGRWDQKVEPLSDDSVASAEIEPISGTEPVSGSSPESGSNAPGSVPELEPSSGVPSPRPGVPPAPSGLPWWFSTVIARTHSTIQNPATPIVNLVNKSPALVPKALCPPIPPKAPAKPPPRPRCTRTSKIRNNDVRNIKIPKMYCVIIAIGTFKMSIDSPALRPNQSKPD